MPVPWNAKSRVEMKSKESELISTDDDWIVVT